MTSGYGVHIIHWWWPRLRVTNEKTGVSTMCWMPWVSRGSLPAALDRIAG